VSHGSYSQVSNPRQLTADNVIQFFQSYLFTVDQTKVVGLKVQRADDQSVVYQHDIQPQELNSASQMAHCMFGSGPTKIHGKVELTIANAQSMQAMIVQKEAEIREEVRKKHQIENYLM
jgi:hypothetical protein